MLENMEKVFEFHRINDRIKESHRTFKKYVTNKNIYYIKNLQGVSCEELFRTYKRTS